MMKTLKISVEQFYVENASSLGLHLLAGADGLKRIIKEPTVNRPGLALAGFTKYFANKRIQTIGSAEATYLKSLSKEERLKRFVAAKFRGWCFPETFVRIRNFWPWRISFLFRSSVVR